MHDALVTARALALVWVLLAAACAAPATAPSALRLDGTRVEPLRGEDPVLLVFVRSDCPIANRYAPELKRLHEAWAETPLRMRLVYPDRDESAESIAKHLSEHGLAIPALRDPEHALVAHAGATITPEAALYLDGELRYRGRIDDRFPDFGKSRAEPSRRDLELAVDALLAGREIEVPRTEAVGCFLGDLP